MQWDLHSIGTDKFFSNQMFTITKTYNNTYRLNMNQKLLDEMKDLISRIDGGSGHDTGADDSDGDLIIPCGLFFTPYLVHIRPC